MTDEFPPSHARDRGWLEHGSASPTRQGWLARRWPHFKLVLLQLSVAAVLATLICVALGHSVPFFAPLVAVALVQVICAPHHRALWLFGFGVVVGLLFGTLFNPAWSTEAAMIDALVGAVVALVVAVAMTPTSPVRLLNEAIEPVLTRLSTNVRSIAAALRGRDTPAAGAAVFALNDIDDDLRRLTEVLLQVRRSALLTRWHSGHRLEEHTQTANEIGHAVRDIRTLARHAWWGVLRTGEPVPAALPQMLDALADGVAVLRDELRDQGKPDEARPLLVSASRWIDVMRAEPLSISASAVAASADSAVLELLTASGMPVRDADQMMHR